MKFTPGPWYEKEGMIASESDPSGQTIAICRNNEANARLIAAAPDLLEALKLVKEFIDHGPSSTRSAWRCKEAYDKAIAKAEGKD